MNIATLPSISNKATFVLFREVIDDATNQVIDLTDTSIVFEIKDMCGDVILTASIGAGITLSSPDANDRILSFTVQFDTSQMGRLCTGTYQISERITRDGITHQSILANIPVLRG